MIDNEDLNKLNILCNQLNLESSAVEIVKAYNKIFNKPDWPEFLLELNPKENTLLLVT